jgi:uncharacterized membrane protein YhaH (DUF805 family)
VVMLALQALVEPTVAAGVAGLYYLVGLWPSLAIYIKRAHDRGRSGWFVALMLVPVLNLWVLVELLFLPGTAGPNSYGSQQFRAAA